METNLLETFLDGMSVKDSKNTLLEKSVLKALFYSDISSCYDVGKGLKENVSLLSLIYLRVFGECRITWFLEFFKGCDLEKISGKDYTQLVETISKGIKSDTLRINVFWNYASVTFLYCASSFVDWTIFIYRLALKHLAKILIDENSLFSRVYPFTVQYFSLFDANIIEEVNAYDFHNLSMATFQKDEEFFDFYAMRFNRTKNIKTSELAKNQIIEIYDNSRCINVSGKYQILGGSPSSYDKDYRNILFFQVYNPSEVSDKPLSLFFEDGLKEIKYKSLDIESAKSKNNNLLYLPKTVTKIDAQILNDFCKVEFFYNENTVMQSDINSISCVMFHGTKKQFLSIYDDEHYRFKTIFLFCYDGLFKI